MFGIGSDNFLFAFRCFGADTVEIAEEEEVEGGETGERRFVGGDETRERERSSFRSDFLIDIDLLNGFGDFFSLLYFSTTSEINY